LEHFVLAAARACINKTATPAMYLNAPRHAGSTRAKDWKTTEKYPACFPDVVKLLLDTLMHLKQAHLEDVGQALRKLALFNTEAIQLDLLGADHDSTAGALAGEVNNTGCVVMRHDTARGV